MLLEPEVRIIGEPADPSAAAAQPSAAAGGSVGANGGRH
jgi:hypothetical protein